MHIIINYVIYYIVSPNLLKLWCIIIKFITKFAVNKVLFWNDQEQSSYDNKDLSLNSLKFYSFKITKFKSSENSKM